EGGGDGSDTEDAGGLSKGDKVEARYRGGAKFYPGKIARVNGDGTFDINYDDGDKEEDVKERLIKSLEKDYEFEYLNLRDKKNQVALAFNPPFPGSPPLFIGADDPLLFVLRKAAVDGGLDYANVRFCHDGQRVDGDGEATATSLGCNSPDGALQLDMFYELVGGSGDEEEGGMLQQLLQIAAEVTEPTETPVVTNAATAMALLQIASEVTEPAETPLVTNAANAMASVLMDENAEADDDDASQLPAAVDGWATDVGSLKAMTQDEMKSIFGRPAAFLGLGEDDRTRFFLAFRDAYNPLVADSSKLVEKTVIENIMTTTTHFCPNLLKDLLIQFINFTDNGKGGGGDVVLEQPRTDDDRAKRIWKHLGPNLGGGNGNIGKWNELGWDWRSQDDIDKAISRLKGMFVKVNLYRMKWLADNEVSPFVAACMQLISVLETGRATVEEAWQLVGVTTEVGEQQAKKAKLQRKIAEYIIRQTLSLEVDTEATQTQLDRALDLDLFALKKEGDGLTHNEDVHGPAFHDSKDGQRKLAKLTKGIRRASEGINSKAAAKLMHPNKTFGRVLSGSLSLNGATFMMVLNRRKDNKDKRWYAGKAWNFDTEEFNPPLREAARSLFGWIVIGENLVKAELIAAFLKYSDFFARHEGLGTSMKVLQNFIYALQKGDMTDTGGRTWKSFNSLGENGPNFDKDAAQNRGWDDFLGHKDDYDRDAHKPRMYNEATDSNAMGELMKILCTVAGVVTKNRSNQMGDGKKFEFGEHSVESIETYWAMIVAGDIPVWFEDAAKRKKNNITYLNILKRIHAEGKPFAEEEEEGGLEGDESGAEGDASAGEE
ncbi:hypothetical protein TeGR_g2542, partial [Tetraparma gracilis]